MSLGSSTWVIQSSCDNIASLITLLIAWIKRSFAKESYKVFSQSHFRRSIRKSLNNARQIPSSHSFCLRNVGVNCNNSVQMSTSSNISVNATQTVLAQEAPNLQAFWILMVPLALNFPCSILVLCIYCLNENYRYELHNHHNLLLYLSISSSNFLTLHSPFISTAQVNCCPPQLASEYFGL